MSKRRKAWDKHKIFAEINRRGHTLKSLSVQGGLHPNSCSNSMFKPFPKADLVISQFLNVPLCELWPDRYDARGNRLSSKKNGSRFARHLKSQKRTGKFGMEARA